MEAAGEALASLGQQLPALRAMLLGVMGPLKSDRGENAEGTVREALALARESGDPDALGVALNACQIILRGSPRVHEALALAEELVSAAPPDGWDGWRNGHHARAVARLALGDRTGFEADVAACERLGAERRFWYFRWIAAMWRAALALLDGRFSEADALAAEAREIAPLAELGTQFFLRQVFRTALEQGDLPAASSVATQLISRWPANQIHRSMVAVIESERSVTDVGWSTLESFVDGNLAPMPPERLPVTLAYRTEVAVAWGTPEQSARLYEVFEPYRGQIVIGGMGEGCMGAVDRYLGMLAAAAGRPTAADAHYETALLLETGLCSSPLLARTRYWYGRMLVDHPGRDHARRADELLTYALDTAKRLGMAGLSAQARTVLDRA